MGTFVYAQQQQQQHGKPFRSRLRRASRNTSSVWAHLQGEPCKIFVDGGGYVPTHHRSPLPVPASNLFTAVASVFVGMESAQPQRSPRGGLAGAMIRRQATGGRGRSRGDNCSPAALLLQSTGSLKKRLRVQLEGVPEMIADVRKSLSAGG